MEPFWARWANCQVQLTWLILLLLLLFYGYLWKLRIKSKKSFQKSIFFLEISYFFFVYLKKNSCFFLPIYFFLPIKRLTYLHVLAFIIEWKSSFLFIEWNIIQNVYLLEINNRSKFPQVNINLNMYQKYEKRENIWVVGMGEYNTFSTGSGWYLLTYFCISSLPSPVYQSTYLSFLTFNNNNKL